MQVERDGITAADERARQRGFKFVLAVVFLDMLGIGIAVPAGSPAPAVRRLSEAFAKALQAPALRERLATLGAEPAGDTSEQFTRMIRADIERWAKIIKSAGITIE